MFMAVLKKISRFVKLLARQSRAAAGNGATVAGMADFCRGIKAGHLFLICFLLAGFLPGCAKKPALTPEQADAEKSLMTFNSELAEMPDGATRFFPNSPFGPTTIQAGPFYISGMGNECRSARVLQGSASYRFALCRQQDDLWHSIPTIFESIN